MTYSINEIAQTLGIKKKYTDYSISLLSTDSRSIFYPQATLFFALKTSNNDAHKFVSELYAQRVRNFVVEYTLPEWETYKDANFLVVKNPLAALQKIAAFHRRKFDIPVIGITGSNGKTVVKEWIYQLLQSAYTVTRSPRSYNSQIGVPLSVWQLDEHSQLGVFEAGISMPDEMAKLETIINPTIGVLCNIGDAHQENFESLKQKCLEKLELFINSEIIICEEDNKLVEDCMEIACLSQKRFTWSRKTSNHSPLQIRKIEKAENSTRIHYYFLQFEFDFEIPFTDDASIENVTSALAVALYLHLPIETICERMPHLEPVAMRLDVRSGKHNTTIINDTYNSDINSLQIALDFMAQRSVKSSITRTLVLSDILQSGLAPEELYLKVLEMINQKKINKLIGIGTGISYNKDIFKKIEHVFFETTDEFIRSGVWRTFKNEIILLKGSRYFEFEHISELLEKRAHETVLDVNLDAIVHNFNFHKSKLKPTTKIICMVKADGYGSGSEEVAKTLQHHNCDYLAVAIAEEGIALRKAGIKIPIIVLNPEVKSFNDLYAYTLEPEVYSFKILDTFVKEAKLKGISNYPIHLKIDTGMHRLGFTREDVPELLDVINAQKSLHIQSIFSHLAASESWMFDEFTTQQIECFKLVANEIEAGCRYTILKHILNSAGIERFPEEQMDMVRLGIGLYGVSASAQQGLKNVCTLKTTILQIKDVPKSETVGYGRKGQLDHNAQIATIRIGYADGLSRRLGNENGKVMVNGTLVSIVGNVCMDLCMIDVTGIAVREGDVVTIFGENPTLIDQAESIGTIPYEILTSVSSRVKRVYFKE